MITITNLIYTYSRTFKDIKRAIRKPLMDVEKKSYHFS